MTNNIQSYWTIDWTSLSYWTIKEQAIEKLKKKEVYGALYKYNTVNELSKGIDTYFASIALYNEPFDKDEFDDIENEGLDRPKKKGKIKVPTLSWLAEYLGTTTFKLRDYVVNEDYKEVLEAATQKMETILVDMAMSWLINNNRLKFYMKNIHMREEQSTVKNVHEEKKDVWIYVIQPTLKQKIESATEIDMIEINQVDEKSQNIEIDNLSKEEDELLDWFW